MTPPAYRPSLDVTRFLAAFGVVVAHVTLSPRDWIGHLALSIFLILSAALSAQSFLRQGGYAMARRLPRLLVPWLFWCAFYWLVDLRLSDRAQIFVWPANPLTLLSGPFIHLWFLPFIAGASFLVAPLGRAIRTTGHLTTALALLAVLSVPAFWLHLDMGVPQPLEQWLYALPIYLLGLFLGFSVPLGQTRRVLLAGVIMTILAATLTNGAPWTFTIFTGIALYLTLWEAPLPISHRFAKALGRDAFGIYLMHPFWLLVMWKFLGTELSPAQEIAGAFLLSWAASAALRRLPVAGALV